MKLGRARLFVFFLCLVLFAACKSRTDTLLMDPQAVSVAHAVSLVRSIVDDDPLAAEALSKLQVLISSSVSKEDVTLKNSAVTGFLSNPMDIGNLLSKHICAACPLPGAHPLALGAAQVLLSTAWGVAPPSSNEAISIRDLTSLTTSLGAIIEKAAYSLEKAYYDLTAEERSFLTAKAHSFLKGLCSGEKDREEEMLYIGLSSRLRQEGIFDAFSNILPLFSEEALNGLRFISGLNHSAIFHDLWALFEGDILFLSNTPLGLFIVGGKGQNVYKGDAAIIVDLGGDDVYLNNAGSPVYDHEKGHITKVVSPVSLVIDIAGNDLYMSTRLGSQGSGILGIGILLDLEGNDTYSGGLLTQGAGFLGVGVLADLGGNDIYSAQEIAQGAGILGAGLLFDAAGNDRYAGAKFAQGFGGPGGKGILLEASGNDLYWAGGKYGSAYGTKNVYHTASQGSAWGLRGKAAGGIGILEDISGDDSYMAGDFSQGTGYYLALGILRDYRGNDRYIGSRYCQGSAAHMAAGLLVDHEGNDLYFSTVAASKAGAWDLAAAWFMDLEGDDQYLGADLSFGSSAQNALAFFLDASGTDRYKAPSMAFGLGGELSYDNGRGAANLGVFLDMGGSLDIYDAEGVGNNKRVRRGLQGLFIDE